MWAHLFRSTPYHCSRINISHFIFTIVLLAPTPLPRTSKGAHLPGWLLATGSGCLVMSAELKRVFFLFFFFFCAHIFHWHLPPISCFPVCTLFPVAFPPHLPPTVSVSVAVAAMGVYFNCVDFVNDPFIMLLEGIPIVIVIVVIISAGLLSLFLMANI